MKTLIKNVKLLAEYGFEKRSVCVLVENERITYIGEEEQPADRVIDGKGNLLMPGFYNTHCHVAMTLLRGYGEDLPLDRWLNERILPAEDRMTDKSAYVSTMLGIAEMIRGGTVSFMDMYMFEDSVAKAVIESGIKANISRCIVAFSDMEKPREDRRFSEAACLVRDFQGVADGRIRVDMSLHAEYTNTEQMFRTVAEYAKEKSLGIQLHISETKKEHLESVMRRNGRTPIRLCLDTGVFDSPTLVAHAVWVSDEDMDIMKEKGVFVSHNAKSNLKLGSGIMPLGKMFEKGINVSLGTDGAASNNRLDMLSELQTATILHKGTSLDPTMTCAADMIRFATVNGARAQRRDDCGRIEVGYRADLVLWDLDSLHNIPSYEYEATIAYSAKSSDVLLTMVDGKILYENGEYKTIDVEKLKYEAKEVIAHYFD